MNKTTRQFLCETSMSKASVTVEESDAGKRLDAYLAGVNAYESRSIAAKFCDKQDVFVNGEPQPKKYKVQLGDLIEYEPEVEDFQMQAEDIPLDIRYEDEHLLVISKQAGLVCHPANKNDKRTLVHALINHCGRQNLCNVTGEE